MAASSPIYRAKGNRLAASVLSVACAACCFGPGRPYSAFLCAAASAIMALLAFSPRFPFAPPPVALARVARGAPEESRAFAAFAACCVLLSLASAGAELPSVASVVLVLASAWLGCTASCAAAATLPACVHLLVAAALHHGHSRAFGGSRASPWLDVASALGYAAVALQARSVVELQHQSLVDCNATLASLQAEEQHSDAVLTLLLPPSIMRSIKDDGESLCFAEEVRRRRRRH